MQDCIELRKYSGDGAYTKRCHQFFEHTLHIPKALLTTSCTHALEMAALLLDLGPGDEVVVPAYTFVSTINAFMLRGVTPVFCDVRADTLNLDESKLPQLLSPKTRAIVPVHYAGVGCEMDAIMDMVSGQDIAIVEDNAHGLFGTYKGSALGTFGTFATQSFHETKNISCGEGGALWLNDLGFAARAEILREKGTDRSRFFRGEVDKYGWVDLGSSFLPSDILAALLLGQLEEHERIQAARHRVWASYQTHLSSWAESIGATTPFVPAHCEHPAHMYYLLMPDHDSRTKYIEHMRSQGIHCVFHYLPLDRSTFMASMPTSMRERSMPCPVTLDVSERLVRLPLFDAMTQAQTARVIEATLQFQ